MAYEKQYDKAQYQQQQMDKVKETLKQLEKGVKEVFTSDKYLGYLKVMSKFHNYSASNSLLIALQNPSATHVAGYGSWKKEFNRQVKKGEKGLQILAPCTYNKQIEREKIDPITQKACIDTKTGKAEVERVEVPVKYFKNVHVFDVSQTDGEPLPTLIDELKGSKEERENILKGIQNISKVPITFEVIKSGAKGYYSPLENKIAIQEGMSDVQTIKTALHELAHSRLHDPSSKEVGRGDTTRNTKEVEAESVAFVVSQYLGVDTSDYSFGYIAAWSSTKELKELKESLKTIQGEAGELINKLEKEMQTLTVEKSQKEHKEPEDQQPFYSFMQNEVYKQLQENPSHLINEKTGLTPNHLGTIKNSSYIERLGRVCQTEEALVKGIKEHLEKLSGIASKVKVEIAFCEQWENKLFTQGEVMSFAEANKRFEKYEKQESGNEAYSKCKMTLYAEVNDKIQVAQMRYDIGDGYAKNLLDFMKKEYKGEKYSALNDLCKEESRGKRSLSERKKEVTNKTCETVVAKKVIKKEKVR